MAHPVYDVASAAFAAGGVVTLAGDVNGPSNANHVDTLTGPGTGIVNLAGGTKLSSPIATIGDIITAAGAVLTFGNGSNPTTVNLRSAANLSLQSAGGGFINLFAAGGGSFIYADASVFQWRTITGVDVARLTPAEITLQLLNAAADPAIPVGGPKIYALAGALKAIGTGGTITTMAAAEPHCPTCGKDFTTEHENPTMGYLAVCLSCMADWIESVAGSQPWIRREKV